MLLETAYRLMGSIMRGGLLIRERVEAGASNTELKIHLEGTTALLDQLARHTGSVGREEFENFKRHLHFIGYYHLRNQPDQYAPDLYDIVMVDTPALIDYLEEWSGSLISPHLQSMVRPAWDAGNYRHAVQDGFIYLERALRALARIPRDKGLSGAALIDKVLGRQSPDRIQLSGEPTLTPVTTGEEEGAFYLFKGAFLLFRNAGAHRFIDYEAPQADELLRLVNICLRILGAEKVSPIVIAMPLQAWSMPVIESLKTVIEQHPGLHPIYLQLEKEQGTTVLRLGDEYKVDTNAELHEALKRILGGASRSGRVIDPTDDLSSLFDASLEE